MGETAIPNVEEKISAITYSLIQNHAFVDGNKRIARANPEDIQAQWSLGQAFGLNKNLLDYCYIFLRGKRQNNISESDLR